MRTSSKIQADLTGESATKGFAKIAKNKHQKTSKGAQRQKSKHTKIHLSVQEELLPYDLGEERIFFLFSKGFIEEDKVRRSSSAR